MDCSCECHYGDDCCAFCISDYSNYCDTYPRLVLPADEFDALLDMLDQPAKINPKLTELVKRTRKWEHHD